MLGSLLSMVKISTTDDEDLDSAALFCFSLAGITQSTSLSQMTGSEQRAREFVNYLLIVGDTSAQT